MEDIRSILSMYKSKLTESEASAPAEEVRVEAPTLSEIPDVFFDEVITEIKLSRSEIAILMVLYRQVWCRPNLYRGHGIGPLNSYSELARTLHLSQEELIHGIHSLEGHGLVQTIRAGQYFVRRFFTEKNDLKYGQHYEF